MSGRLWSLLIATLAIPALLPAQAGQFLVRLGRDTLALERYTRTADRLEGEQVVRSPRTVHRLYTATLDRKSTRLNSSHGYISYAVFCLKKKKKNRHHLRIRKPTAQRCTTPAHSTNKTDTTTALKPNTTAV